LTPVKTAATDQLLQNC